MADVLRRFVQWFRDAANDADRGPLLGDFAPEVPRYGAVADVPGPQPIRDRDGAGNGGLGLACVIVCCGASSCVVMTTIFTLVAVVSLPLVTGFYTVRLTTSLLKSWMQSLWECRCGGFQHTFREFGEAVQNFTSSCGEKLTQVSPISTVYFTVPFNHVVLVMAGGLGFTVATVIYVVLLVNAFRMASTPSFR